MILFYQQRSSKLASFLGHRNVITTTLNHIKLEQLERLRSEDTPRRLMITHTIESYWIPSQKKTKSKLQIKRICQNFKFLNFETGITRDTPSEVAW